MNRAATSTGPPATPPAASSPVRRWMSYALTTARPGTPLRTIVRVMTTRGIRHVPVVDDARRPVGIVTARDLRQAMFAPAATECPDPAAVLEGMTAADVMVRPVVTIAPETSVRDAARLMHEHRVGALPVVHRGRVVGILTDTDLLVAFRRLCGGRR